LSSLSSLQNFVKPTIMSKSQFERLEENVQCAEILISDIYSKLSDIQAATVDSSKLESPELLRLREENKALRLEVAKWKELLILREIKLGKAPIIDNPVEVGKSAKKSPSAAPHLSANNGEHQGKGQGAKDNRKSKSVSILHTSNDTTSKASPHVKVGSEKKLVPPATAPPAIKGTTTRPASSSSSAESKSGGGTVDDGEVDVSKLDMRVGVIVECEKHPDADALYVEKIDLGEDKPRTIISGLVKFVPIEEMRNRLVVVLANLKPAKMRGIMSEGMVMCASSPEKVEILAPPTGSSPGDVVEVDGFPRNPEAVLNPKKKIFETVQPFLKTNEKLEATYKGNLWKVPGKGVITAKSMAHSMIK